jgi:hypothetical protein
MRHYAPLKWPNTLSPNARQPTRSRPE